MSRHREPDRLLVPFGPLRSEGRMTLHELKLLRVRCRPFPDDARIPHLRSFSDLRTGVGGPMLTRRSFSPWTMVFG